MFRLYQNHHPEDFQARIRIFTADEGGRSKPPHNGVRWDFMYEEESDLYVIWPDFFDEDGNSFSTEKPLPINESIMARMYIVNPEMRVKIHRARIREGIRFYCMEGSIRVAEGIVWKLVGLHENSPR
jgi:hypothetical protein